MKIKKGDQVKIISGNDKGKQGKVMSVFPMEGKLVVEGANIKKRHMRPRKQGQKGELVKVAAPIRVSRVMLVCGKCGKTTRPAMGIEKDKKHRICKKCGGNF